MTDRKISRYSDGLILGLALAFAGVILQFFLGPLHWDRFGFPDNVILLLVWAAAVVVMFLLRGKSARIRWMMRLDAAVPSIAWCVAPTIILGLTSWNLLTSWSFSLEYAWMATVLALACLNRLSRFSCKDIPFLMNHLGLLTALTAGALGTGDMVKSDITLNNGETADSPIVLTLHHFNMEVYPPELSLKGEGLKKGSFNGWEITTLETIPDAAPDPSANGGEYKAWFQNGACCAMLVKADKEGKTASGWVTSGSWLFPPQSLALPDGTEVVMLPQQSKGYCSEVSARTPDGRSAEGIIEVNKPLKVGPWRIVQKGYDTSKGRWSESSTLQVIKDPWGKALDLGIYFMLAGAVLNFLKVARRKKEVKG